MEKTLIILRGCSGAGKSTMAKALTAANPNAVICSTDSFFLDNTGKYVFDPSKLGVNHKKCQDKADSHMSAGTPLVVIDNTNTTRWEMKPYVDMAAKYGYTVQYVTVSCDIELCIKRNVHQVPAEAIRRMAARFEHDPIGPVETPNAKAS